MSVLNSFKGKLLLPIISLLSPLAFADSEVIPKDRVITEVTAYEELTFCEIFPRI